LALAVIALAAVQSSDALRAKLLEAPCVSFDPAGAGLNGLFPVGAVPAGCGTLPPLRSPYGVGRNACHRALWSLERGSCNPAAARLLHRGKSDQRAPVLAFRWPDFIPDSEKVGDGVERCGSESVVQPAFGLQTVPRSLRPPLEEFPFAWVPSSNRDALNRTKSYIIRAGFAPLPSRHGSNRCKAADDGSSPSGLRACARACRTVRCTPSSPSRLQAMCDPKHHAISRASVTSRSAIGSRHHAVSSRSC